MATVSNNNVSTQALIGYFSGLRAKTTARRGGFAGSERIDENGGMQESNSHRSVRGAFSNERPYRELSENTC